MESQNLTSSNPIQGHSSNYGSIHNDNKPKKDGLFTKIKNTFIKHFGGLTSQEKVVVGKFNATYKSAISEKSKEIVKNFESITKLTQKTFSKNKTLVEETAFQINNQKDTISNKVGELSEKINELNTTLGSLKDLKATSGKVRNSVDKQINLFSKKINHLTQVKNHYEGRLQLTEKHIEINKAIKTLSDGIKDKKSLDNNDLVNNQNLVSHVIDFSTLLIEKIKADPDLVINKNGHYEIVNKDLKKILRDNLENQNVTLAYSEIEKILQIAFPGLKAPVTNTFVALGNLSERLALKIEINMQKTEKIFNEIEKKLLHELNNQKNLSKAELVKFKAKREALYKKLDINQLKTSEQIIQYLMRYDIDKKTKLSEKLLTLIAIADKLHTRKEIEDILDAQIALKGKKQIDQDAVHELSADLFFMTLLEAKNKLATICDNYPRLHGDMNDKERLKAIKLEYPGLAQKVKAFSKLK